MIRECNRCGGEYEAKRATSQYCSTRCRGRNHVSKRTRTTINSVMRYQILRRDSFRCRYCGAEPGERELKVDHIVPVAHGGRPDDVNNLVTACEPCNAGKGDTVIDPAEVPAPRGDS